MYYYVYRISCFHPESTANYYYGSRASHHHPSVDINYWSSSRYVRAAREKFGHQWFTKKIISIYSTRVEALAKEIRLHAYFNVKDHPRFFNRANQTSVRFIPCPDPNQSQRQVGNTYALGHTHSQATRDRIAAAKRGQRHTLETRAKMAAARQGKPSPMLGKHHSQVTRDQMSARIQENCLFRGKSHTPETREVISSRMQGNQRRVGKSHTQETRDKIAATLRKRRSLSTLNVENIEIDVNGEIVSPGKTTRCNLCKE